MSECDELRCDIRRLEVDLSRAEDRIRSLEQDVEWMRNKIWSLEAKLDEHIGPQE